MRRNILKQAKRLAGVLLSAVLTAALLPAGGLHGLTGANRNAASGKVDAAVTLSNPRIVEDSSVWSSKQNVTWDCVWFGRYPKTEIVKSGSNEETALKQMNMETECKIEYESVSKEDFEIIQNAFKDNEKDVNVNGIKYRRCKAEEATAFFFDEDGFYKWANDTAYHYFRYEPIKWRVLSVSNGRAFLLADEILDDRPYHTLYQNVTWEGSTIRSWLNGYGGESNQCSEDYSSNNFIDSAFSAAEQEAIPTVTVENADSLAYDGSADGGNDTQDKIFLLSETETWGDKAAAYGFVSGVSITDEGRISKMSTYAYAMGIRSDKSRTCFWWLRSPGKHSIYASFVNGLGAYCSGYSVGQEVNATDYGVRPALYLDLSSSHYSQAGTVCSKEAENSSNTGTATPGNGGSTGSVIKPPVKVTRIQLSGISNKVAAGKRIKLIADVFPANASNRHLVWTSSNNKAASVSQGGVVALKKKSGGKSAIITAAAADGSGVKAVYKIKIMKGAVKKVAVAGAKTRTVKAGKAIKLKAKVTAEKGANKKLRWVSSNTKYATVSASGKVKTKKAGKKKNVKITAMATDGSNKKAVVRIKLK